MEDIFHRLVPDSFLEELWTYMVSLPHIYQILTKRADRLARWPGTWPPHIWAGVTADHPMTKWRINALRDSGAAVKFISMEPLVDSMLPLNLKGIDQVIVGGKSGSMDAASHTGGWRLWEQCNGYSTSQIAAGIGH